MARATDIDTKSSDGERHEPKASEYWRKHVLSWEASAYLETGAKGGRFRLSDRLAKFFRGDSMFRRMNGAIELVEDQISGMTVLDVGCASGRLARRLLELGAARVIGVDVAESAIEVAESMRAESGLAERLEFHVIDVTAKEAELPAVDLVTALGVIEYFDRPALDRFLCNLKTKYFVIHFPDRDNAKRAGPLRPLLRSVYLWFNRCPGVYFYGLDEFREIAARHGFEGIRASGEYVTNLPA